MEVKDILGLGETSTKLIEVIAKGIGTAWNPIQIRLEASAKAYEIKKIAEAVNSTNDAQKSIEYNGGNLTVISDKGYFPTEVYAELSTRITDRTMYQQAKKQLNLENTIYFAKEEFISGETVSNEPLDDDWITRFFNIAEDINNEQMQHLWGRILAGEVKQPKSFSLRTLEVLRNLSPAEAEIFHKVSQYAIEDSAGHFIIKDLNYLEKNFDIKFSDLLLLTDLGLLSSTEGISISYHGNDANGEKETLIIGKNAILIKREKNAPKFSINIYAFTTVGKELSQLIESTSNENYINYIVDNFRGMKNSELFRTIIINKNGELIYGDLIQQ